MGQQGMGQQGMGQQSMTQKGWGGMGQQSIGQQGWGGMAQQSMGHPSTAQHSMGVQAGPQGSMSENLEGQQALWQYLQRAWRVCCCPAPCEDHQQWEGVVVLLPRVSGCQKCKQSPSANARSVTAR